MAIAGGIALDLAFPGVGWWWLPPVAVAMLVIALDGRGIRWGAFVGFVFGAAFFVPHLAWSGIYVGKMPWLALATLETLYFAVLGAAATVALRCSRRSAMQAVAFGCLWVGQEAVRSRTPFGGFPWGRLAFSQSDAPSVGLAAIGGAPLVSFAVAVSGALLGQTILVVSRRGHLTASTVLGERAGAVVLLIAAAVVFSAGGLVPRPGAGDAAAGDRRVTVGAVQGNVPTAGLDFNAERRAVLRNHADATGRLAADVATSAMTRPDLVLWPENASDIDPLRDTAAADMISEAVDQVGVPVLVGTVLQEPAPKISNTSIVWNPGTGPGERYVKRRPVPFGEYIPYRSFFRKITAKVDLVKADFTAGRGPNVLKVGPATVGVGICFEVAFDDLLKDAVDNGADLLVIQTNNATFGRTDESVQQLAMSRLRAVEYGRSVVHISTVGVSALIGPDGAIQQKSGHFTQEILTGTLPLRTDRTIATRIGAWPEALLIAIGLISVAAGGLRIAARRR
ncbi:MULTISPECIES: apolipoprotein N-acyltransferase [unclassified Kribbella]|uniref:apolipoprotein N-acyltransferase n=1 Tax=unclassified Kribbella TaxID=2644121 RepID=UPI00301A7505